ncbi:MAG: hypothetical protein M3421_11780 [Bacteroidota bacterium]|nr:hypothetical protein [Bacteroidota bacterium]
MQIIKKTLKIISFICIGIVLLLLVVSIFIDPIAKNFLENKINDADEGQYSAQIDDVNISILRGNFIVNGIRLQTDTLTARENETPVIDLEAGEISVEGVSWLNFLFTNKLQLDRISFLDLRVEAKVRTTDTAETTGPFKWEDLDIYPIIKDQVDRIRLNDLRFRNIDLTLLNIETNDTLKFSAEEFNLNSDDILIDADRVFTDARSFYASRIDIQGKEVKIKRAGDPQWEADLKLIECKTRDSNLGIFLENVQFFRRGSSESDTIVFGMVQEFNLLNLNLNKVQADSIAKIEKIAINQMRLINNFDIDEEDVKEADKKSAGFDVTKFSLGDNLPDLLDKVIIDEIDLQGIQYKELEHLSVKNLSFSTRNMKVDKNPAFSDNKFLHAEQFEVSVEAINYLEREQLIQLALNDFNINIEDGLGHLALNRVTANHIKRTPGQIYTEAKLGGFKITGINTRDLTDKKFSIDSIAIEYPDVLVDLGGQANDAAEDEVDAPLDLYPAIKNVLSEVQINKIALIEGNFRISGMEGNQNTVHLPAVYVQLSDLLIAEGTAFAGGRILHSDDIAVRMERIQYPFPDNVHHVNLDLLRMSTREKFLRAYGLSFDYNRNYKKIFEGPEANQVLNVTNSSLLIDNLEYASLIKEQGFFATSIKSEGLKVEVYKDNNYTAEESEDFHATPQQMIKDIGLPFYLGELSVNNANIIFKELAEGAEEMGRISVNDLNLSINELTNVDNIIRNKPEAIFNVNGLLMGDGFFETEMIIPMHDENQPVRIAGKLDTLDLTKLNSYTEFTTRFGVESGTIYKVLWDFEADKEQAAGKFGLSYEDLSVQLSESESPAPAGTLYQVGAYLANALVLDSDVAASKSEKPETVEFEREKDEEESFIEHYISALMAGFVEIMGFPLSIINP